ncbi:putative Ig domain-containing protein, partial [Vibrio breoganii]
MNNKNILALSIALALAGCGGDDEGGNNSPESITEQFTITAIDGYLADADVYADRNQNGTADQSELVGQTDANGEIKIDVKDEIYAIIVKAIAGKTVDSERGIITDNFELQAPEGFDVVSPMTNLVSKQLANNPDLTVEDAKTVVIENIVGDSLQVDAADVFGDYIANIETDEAAKALNAIGEALVDLDKKGVEADIETILEVVKQIADILDEIIEKEEPIDDDFSPVIDIPEDGGLPIVEENHRPSADSSPLDQSIELETPIVDIDLSGFFFDVDGDVLTYEVKLIGSEGLNGLTLVDGILSGIPTTAGEFSYVFIASDASTSSEPVEFKLTVTTPNEVPVVNNEVKASIQNELDGLLITAGEAIDVNIDITVLFIDDDTLTLRTGGVDAAYGLTVSIAENTLTVKGTPTMDGSFSFNVIADDNVNSAVSTPFSFEIVEAIVEVKHPLEETVWYYTENGTSDGESSEQGYPRIWCESIQLIDGDVYMGVRTPSNRTSCSFAPLEQFVGASYVVEDGVLTVSWDDSEGEGDPDIQYSEFSLLEDGSLIADGAKVATVWGEPRILFSDTSTIEKRLNQTSDAAEGELDFPMYLPNPTGADKLLGQFSVSIEKDSDTTTDVDITFDNALGNDITCSTIRSTFEDFAFTGEFSSGQNTYFFNASGVECYDNEENGVTFAGVDLDINDGLLKDSVYSIIGDSEELTPVHVNVKWVGDTWTYDDSDPVDPVD